MGRAAFIVQGFLGSVALLGSLPAASTLFLSAAEPSTETSNAAAVESKQAPRAVMESTTRDVGDIPCGKPATFEFQMTNAGTAPLEIVARPHCGCTVIDCDRTIAAGQTGKIKAELRTSSLRGEFTKSVEIQTNDPRRPGFRLVITGRVVNAVEIKPARNPRATLRLTGSTEINVDLLAIAGVEVTNVTCNVPYARAELIPQGEHGYRLNVTISSQAPPGRSNFVAMLSTTAEYQRQIPVAVYCEKGILVTPPNFGFGSGRRDREAPLTSMVILRKPGGPLRIRAAASSSPNVEVEIVTLKEGSLYRLIAHCRGELSALQESTTVTVETDDPDQPKLEIPIRRAAGISKP